jgi:hypothetical protein
LSDSAVFDRPFLNRSQNAEAEFLRLFLFLHSDFRIPRISSVPAPALFQYRGKVSATEIKPLRDVASDGDFRSIPRHSITLAENPHAASAVIDFENAGAKRAERTRDPSGNGDFLPGKASGIAVNVRNSGSLRTPR